MTCDKTTEQLIDWLEGELPPAVDEEIEKHVGGCADCAKEVHEIRQALAAVAHPVEDPGEGYFGSFYARLRQPLEEANGRGFWLRRWWEELLTPRVWMRALAGVAAAALVVVGALTATGTLAFRHSPQRMLAKLSPAAGGLHVALARTSLARVDPTVTQEVFSLKKEEVQDLQIQIAKVIMGQFVNSRVVALPGERPTSHVIYAPAVADLNDEELAEVTNTLSKEAQNWTL
jgi:anti-sigma factor RsiW